MTKFFLNVYETSRAYGGPEEGGWWYNCGEFLECLGEFKDRVEGMKARDNAFEENEREAPYRMGANSTDGCDPSGEANDDFLMRGGRWGQGNITFALEEQKGADYPSEQPYYE